MGLREKLYWFALALVCRIVAVVAPLIVNTRAMVSRIIMFAIGLYVAAAVLPGAIINLTCATSWTGVPAAVLTLGTTVAGLVAVTVFLIIMLKSGGIQD